MWYFVIILGIIAIDQIVKYIVSTFMYVYQSITVVENLFYITYIQNDGAAFSILSGQKWILVTFTFVLLTLAVLFFLKKRKNGNVVMLTGMTFIIGGGIGNLIDRSLKGYVVDYFDFEIFPIFNMADIFVSVGCGLILLYIIFLEGKENARRNTV